MNVCKPLHCQSQICLDFNTWKPSTDLMETNTWEFDCGHSGVVRLFMFEFSCHNKIASISVMVKAIRKCEYGLELPLNLTDLIISQ